MIEQIYKLLQVIPVERMSRQTQILAGRYEIPMEIKDIKKQFKYKKDGSK
jgi:hypothetical protein